MLTALCFSSSSITLLLSPSLFHSLYLCISPHLPAVLCTPIIHVSLHFRVSVSKPLYLSHSTYISLKLSVSVYHHHHPVLPLYRRLHVNLQRTATRYYRRFRLFLFPLHQERYLRGRRSHSGKIYEYALIPLKKSEICVAS